MKCLNVLVLIASPIAFAMFLLAPGASLRFMLADEPLNGWLGSAFFALAAIGPFVIAGAVAALIKRADKLIARHPRSRAN